MVIDPTWLSSTKEIDPDYAGSIWEQMGWDAELCPTCGAHLHGSICLNACHLTSLSQERFRKIMEMVAASRERTEPDRQTEWP